MVKLIKKVDYQHTYVGKKDGKVHPSVNYYVQWESPSGRAVSVAIFPAYEKHLATDLAYLELMCDEIIKIEKPAE